MNRLPWPILFAALLAGCAGPQEASTSQYHYLYDEPLVTPGTKFARLPLTVQHTIRAEAGMAQIEDIQKEVHAGRPIYRVTFNNYLSYPPLYIASDGSLLNPDLTVAVAAPPELASLLTAAPFARITLNDLPPPVIKTVQTRAPDAEIDTITKETRGTETTYVVAFKDHKPARVFVSAQGVVLKEEP